MLQVCLRLFSPAQAAQNCTQGPIGSPLYGCCLAVILFLYVFFAAAGPWHRAASPCARLCEYLVQTEHATIDGVSCRKLTGDDIIGWCPILAALYAIVISLVGTAGQWGPPCVRVLRHFVQMCLRSLWCHSYLWALMGSPGGAGLLAW